MGKKSKILNRNKFKVKAKLKRNERFARKLIEEKYISLSLKNKELVEENVNLLSQIETLKTEKSEIYKTLIDLMPKQNKFNTNNINSSLLLILETIKSEHKRNQELILKSNNEMIDRISDEIKGLINSNENNEPKSESKSYSHNNNNKTNEIMSAQELDEWRRQSFKRKERIYHKNYDNLSVIEEQSNERTIDSTNELTIMETSVKRSVKRSVKTSVKTDMSNDNVFKTPKRVNNSCNTEYEMTPDFEVEKFGTPSIYNFDSDSLINKSDDYSKSIHLDRTSLLWEPLNSPELTIHDLETTVTDEESNGMTTSTPLYTIRKSGVNKDVSKRISSISRPYSPLKNRSSLINIQNVFENRPNLRKSSITNIDTKTITNSLLNNNSNDTKSINTTKKKRKKCSTNSNVSESSISSDGSNNSTNSYSRRNRLPVSYKEPPLNRKIRRGDNDWTKN